MPTLNMIFSAVAEEARTGPINLDRAESLGYEATADMWRLKRDGNPRLVLEVCGEPFELPPLPEAMKGWDPREAMLYHLRQTVFERFHVILPTAEVRRWLQQAYERAGWDPLLSLPDTQAPTTAAADCVLCSHPWGTHRKSDQACPVSLDGIPQFSPGSRYRAGVALVRRAEVYEKPGDLPPGSRLTAIATSGQEPVPPLPECGRCGCLLSSHRAEDQACPGAGDERGGWSLTGRFKLREPEPEPFPTSPPCAHCGFGWGEHAAPDDRCPWPRTTSYTRPAT